MGTVKEKMKVREGRKEREREGKEEQAAARVAENAYQGRKLARSMIQTRSGGDLCDIHAGCIAQEQRACA